MMAWVKFGVETGEEFEAPAFSTIWRWVGPKVRKGSVYIATFNRRPDDPMALILGKPGWAQSEHSAGQALIDLDQVEP